MINLRKLGFVPVIALVLLVSACGSTTGPGPSEIPPPGPKSMM